MSRIKPTDAVSRKADCLPENNTANAKQTLFPNLVRGVTWSEPYRLQCEARMLLRCARDRRLQYYDNIKRRRGEDAFKQLNAMVRQCYLDLSQDQAGAR